MKLHRMTLALASAAVAICAFAGPPVAAADPETERASSVTAPLNSPITENEVTYTLTSATLENDVDDSVRLDIGVTAAAGDGYGLNFWDSSFRLSAGSETYAPVSGLNELVDANSTKSGTISFVVPDTTTAATLVISFPGDVEKDVPLTLDAGAISQTGSDGGDGVTVPLNTPFSSGEVTYTITAATAKAVADQSIQLDLVIKAAAGDGYGLNFWDSSFRLTVGTESYAPVSDLNEIVEANSTKSGTVSFVVPNTTTAATLVISFTDGDKSVPVTFGGRPAR